MQFRKKVLSTGTEITLGKDEESNDELMIMSRGKDNTILHTLAPGSPFCVIETLNPSKQEIYEAGVFTARYSQDWRDNKGEVGMSVFTGKSISKSKGMKVGTWSVKKPKSIIIKREDILLIDKKE